MEDYRSTHMKHLEQLAGIVQVQEEHGAQNHSVLNIHDTEKAITQEEAELCRSAITQVILPEPLTVTTFYKFTDIADAANLRFKLFKVCQDNGILGTILISENEGVNGTVAGSTEALSRFYAAVKEFDPLADMDFKESVSEIRPFAKLKVKIKKEIITFKIPEAHGSQATERLDYAAWEKMLDKGAVVVDTRNDYEHAFGTFIGAVNPRTRNFTDMASWMDQHLQHSDHSTPILMFCTGGVRCEKSTAYLKHKGFKEVYHLDGGVIKYLQQSPNKRKYWQGNCFVFDDRIAIDYDLKPAIYNAPLWNLADVKQVQAAHRAQNHSVLIVDDDLSNLSDEAIVPEAVAFMNRSNQEEETCQYNAV
jgi:UPF0176 protein